MAGWPMLAPSARASSALTRTRDVVPGGEVAEAEPLQAVDDRGGGPALPRP